MAEIEKCDVVCANCHRIRTCEAQRWRMVDRAYRNPRRKDAYVAVRRDATGEPA